MTLTTEEQLQRGTNYYFGQGVKQDFAEAAKWFRKAARKGSEDPVAQYYLGSMYSRGEGVPQSNASAMRWFLLAAEQGDPDAQWELGEAHRSGIGKQWNPSKAIEWFRRAADQGDVDAQYSLGQMYRKGSRGWSSDHADAVKLFRLAATQGHADAQVAVGDMLTGVYQGVAQDYDEAVTWYQLAAEQGDERAQRRVENCKSVLTEHEDKADSVKLLRNAADKGDLDAQNKLGFMYEHGGNGVTRDTKKAVKWYCMAADQGHADSQYRLGRIYKNKRDIQHDDTQTVKWYRMAANQGHIKAQYDLARMYLHSEGVEDFRDAKENRAEALNLYRQIAELEGHDDEVLIAAAQCQLGFHCQDDGNYEESMKWFLKSAGRSYGHALIALAENYEEGVGVTKSDTESYFWYEAYFLCDGDPNYRGVDYVKARKRAAKKLSCDEIDAIKSRATKFYERAKQFRGW